MKILILLLFPLFLNSQNYVSPELQIYLNDYKNNIHPSDSLLNKIDSIILLKDTTFLFEGQIAIGSYDTVENKIQIATKSSFLYKQSEDFRYYQHILYHELGHYLYKLPHEEDGCQIMNEVTEDLFLYNWEENLKQYKKQIKWKNN